MASPANTRRDPMLIQCWHTVADGVPSFNQHRITCCVCGIPDSTFKCNHAEKGGSENVGSLTEIPGDANLGDERAQQRIIVWKNRTS